MNYKHYVSNNPKKMLLRDHLAFDRTVLANERTFLAYVRFAIMALATGLTFLKVFSDDSVLVPIGIVAIGCSALFFIVGSVKFVVFRKKLKEVYRPLSK